MYSDWCRAVPRALHDGERRYMALLGAIVKALRKSRKEPQRITAEAIGLSLVSYKRLEAGDYLASGYDLQRLVRHFRLDANLLVLGFTLIASPGIGAEYAAQRWQRLVYRLRALDYITQNALTELTVDLYQLHLDTGGEPAEQAALEAEQRLIDALQQED